MGRGIIDEPDDLRADNPPTYPQLLASLERELVESGYDMKHVFRLILNSRSYQQSAFARGDYTAATANFACYPIRRMDAEVLADVLCELTGTKEKYISMIPEPFTYIPGDTRTIAIADGSITSAFLQLFGRRLPCWANRQIPAPISVMRFPPGGRLERRFVSCSVVAT